ncbi:pilus assembly protein [Methylosinus sp. C49]|uniref:AAA family ATPase n=1 Tax=Methylosinus sp. C49 TaxID=2699395 RepID=UPI0013675CAC|nr:CtpF protein [Methylosinus sp. C49]BBU62681.1 pilus assembly protein [Methylosinus sp. C49]
MKEQSAIADSDAAAQIAPLPRISVQAFCETPDAVAVVNSAAVDRRMDKAHVKVHMGGVAAAIEAFRSAPTPNLIVLEAIGERETLIGQLETLAESCDSGTKVVVLGHVNDISLYRALMARGVSDYIVAPIDVLGFIARISDLYNNSAESLGRIVAVAGAKGGVGSSCIAHNLAWSIARSLQMQTVVADLDLPFGTAGLDFNQDPPQGVAEAVFAPDRVDANLIDRLLSKCSEQLSLLAAPATVDRLYDLPETAFDAIVDTLRATAPCTVLDVPHQWSAWTKRMLIGADEVAIVAAPDLANLRNAKTLIDQLRVARQNDAPPKLVLNFVGVPKRPEIAVADFAKAIEMEPSAIIPFDPKLFGAASNNGQMIAEVDPGSKIIEQFDALGREVTGRAVSRKVKSGLLAPLLDRLSRKLAG